MNEPPPALRIEPRWPVALTMIAVAFVLVALPERIRLLPSWTPYAVILVMLAPMAAVTLTAAKAQWLRVETGITGLFLLVVGAGTLSSLVYLTRAMVRQREDIDGIQLLSSSIGVWITNVLTFSLIYWRIDRGGPEARANNAGTKPDWLFPQAGAPADVPPDWRPTFIDYLFLGFSTATAFSPTDALPLTSRAKMLMMVESSIALGTLVIVGARAINILGS